MKIISVDNYNREDVADVLVLERVPPGVARALVDKFNDEAGPNPARWHRAVADDYRLSRGMEDLV